METSCLRDLSSVCVCVCFFRVFLLVTKAVVMVSAMNLANLMGRILVSWDPQVGVAEISHDGWTHGTKRVR